ncbi:MAG: Ig-like domain repeat protein, partial [Myxococcales bacterium]|nr:Ig-like domain repeat protein [Myxococcales bacterium]
MSRDKSSPPPKSSGKPLGERIRDVLDAILGESAAPERAEAGASAREFKDLFTTNRARSTDPTLLEEAVRRVGETLENWRGGKSLLPLVHETGRDRVAAVGREVELAVKVEALFRGGLDLAEKTVRFLVDEESVGEAVTDETGIARLLHAPARRGIHSITYEVVGDTGVVLRSMKPGQHGLLQVV